MTHLLKRYLNQGFNLKFWFEGKPVVIDNVYKTPGARMVEVYLRSAFGQEDPKGIKPEYRLSKPATKSQTQAIKEWLLSGKSITPLEALEHFGCLRLGARIADLRKQGLHIECKTDMDSRTGKRYGTYWLVKEPENQ